MNRRVLLAIAAVAVLGAALVLFLKLREPTGASAEPVSAAPTTPARPSTPSQVGSRDPARPGAPIVTPGAEGRGAPPDDATKEVTINGIRIRDHRTGTHAPIDLPPNIHAPDSRKISPILTNDISQKLQAVMSECAASVPSEARGTKPRLEGTISIAIKDHQARITSSAMQLRDVVGASVDPTKQCIEQKSLGIATPAGDETDVESYTISINFALR
ncbi:MAG: hypothetical protein H6Q90_5123 [Deltaproteobacteria bacterium]|nr:hypothetical protein [Deltaproteobacteria bacterium]